MEQKILLRVLKKTSEGYKYMVRILLDMNSCNLAFASLFLLQDSTKHFHAKSMSFSRLKLAYFDFTLKIFHDTNLPSYMPLCSVIDFGSTSEDFP